MGSFAIFAAGGGLVAIVVVIILAMTLTRRHRIVQSDSQTDRLAGSSDSGSAEQAEALRSVQEQIERGSRLL